MSRYRSASSYDQRCHRVGYDDYDISWMVDFYYAGSRLRYPRRVHRRTDKKGAERFCKKWKLTMPPEPTK